MRDKSGIIRSLILHSQHLLTPGDESVEEIVSDICGLQYDPFPAIHLNQYMMLWNRMKDFRPEMLDDSVYKEHSLIETWTFKRNMFIIPRDEYTLYRKASKGIVRWGESDENWFASGDSDEVRDAEAFLKDRLSDCPGATANGIWDMLGFSDEWDKYRRRHDKNFDLPVFRAFYRMIRRGDLITCGRKPGTFREPVYILREKAGIPPWEEDDITEKDAVKYVTEKLIRAFGVTDPVHISHISGLRTAELIPIFDDLEKEEKITRLPLKAGRKEYYIHSANTPLLSGEPKESREVRLISPMDTLVRDKTWLKTFFGYSFSFEYFKKKGMKWPLSILVGNGFAGWLDCRMDRKTRQFIVKEKCVFDGHSNHAEDIEKAIKKLADFHDAKEVVYVK